MANTTNYNWETPDDTDLVKDGAAAIRTLGSSIDTTTKALNPSTTLGDIEYRSSTANTNTRLAIGSTGQVLTVAGGVPTWATSDDANAIQNALLTTTGDTIYASGASTPARLGVGSTGDVLTVAGGVPTWAAPASGGGMTLLSTTTMSGATTTISSISGSYNQLYVIWYGMTNSTGNGYMEMKFNNTGNYSGIKSIGSSGSPTAQAENNVSIVRLSYGVNPSTNANNFAAMTIDDYASTSNRKTFTVSFNYASSEIIDYTGAFLNNAAISELNFSNTGGNWSAGTVKIYGVK